MSTRTQRTGSVPFLWKTTSTPPATVRLLKLSVKSMTSPHDITSCAFHRARAEQDREQRHSSAHLGRYRRCVRFLFPPHHTIPRPSGTPLSTCSLHVFRSYSADWLCNVEGGRGVVSQLTFPGSDKFKETKTGNYAVNGKVVGKFKTAGKFSYLEVSDAGHEVPAYQPAAALQAFTQTIYQQALYST